jgi:THO complex subunit 2
LLSKLSFDTRYAMYGEWQQVLLKSNPHLKLASSKAEKNTKDVLKRLSKTNVREMMRKLAKVSYTNPITTFNVFISQVESYDNLTDLVVEAARYFTDMGWDALPYAIMTQLSSGRGTYQSSGLHDQKWILCR